MTTEALMTSPFWRQQASDPDGFVHSFEEPRATDEFQRVPDPMRALELSIDKDRRPGRFLLTGAACK